MQYLNHLRNRCKQDPYSLGVVDLEDELFTRFVYNLSGQLAGYQLYNWRSDKNKRNDIKGRYWTWLRKPDNKHTMQCLLGLEHVQWGKTLYLVEGQFEQATAMAYGLNCVAVLCNNPKPLRNWVTCYPANVVALCQNDDAGRKLANVAKEAVYLDKDVDEMERDELLTLL